MEYLPGIGNIIPRCVEALVKERKINHTEAYVLSVINSLAHGPRGCYASNQWIADRVGVGIRQTQDIIAHLERLGLVHKNLNKRTNARLLTTLWSELDNAVLTGTRMAGTQAEGVNKRANKTSRGVNKTSHRVLSNSKHTPRGGGVGELKYHTNTETGEVMPFFQTEAATPPNKDDMAFAILLKNTIQERKGLQARYSMKGWMKQFQLLRKTDGVAVERIQKTLTWYCKHIGERYVPVAYSAAAFRKKFLQIETASKRGTTAMLEAEVSPEAATIAKDIGLQWPKAAKADDFASAIQLTIDEHRMTKCIIRLAMKKGTLPRGYAERVLVELGDMEAFVKRWWRDAHQLVSKWDKWSGKFEGLAFSRQHTKLEQMLETISQQWAGTRKHGELAMELLRHEDITA